MLFGEEDIRHQATTFPFQKYYEGNSNPLFIVVYQIQASGATQCRELLNDVVENR